MPLIGIWRCSRMDLHRKQKSPAARRGWSDMTNAGGCRVSPPWCKRFGDGLVPASFCQAEGQAMRSSSRGCGRHRFRGSASTRLELRRRDIGAGNDETTLDVVHGFSRAPASPRVSTVLGTAERPPSPRDRASHTHSRISCCRHGQHGHAESVEWCGRVIDGKAPSGRTRNSEGRMTREEIVVGYRRYSWGLKDDTGGASS